MDTARNLEKGREAQGKLLSSVMPGPLKLMAGSLSGGSYLKKRWSQSLKNSKQGIMRLHQAGVPIVMGSDTVYSQFALYAFHGYTSLRKIGLLG